jgi:proteasome accessory factor C
MLPWWSVVESMAEQVSDRISRLLALVPWLTKRPGITLTETAEHFGISVETLTKDLWQIVLCGLPGYGPDQLVDIDFWDDDRIWVHDPQTLTVPMRISSDEAIALSIALRRMSQIPGVSEKESINRLIVAMDDVTGAAVSVVAPANAEQNARSELIELALANNLSLSFTYSSGKDGHSKRNVAPIRVFSIDDFLYLTAWCEQAEAVRTFRFDRITDLTSGEPLTHAGVDLTVEVTGLADLALAPTALIRIDPAIAWVTEEAWVTQAPDGPWLRKEGQILISVPYLSKEWLTRWVLSMGGAATVLEPSDFAEEIREMVMKSMVRLSK